MGDISNKTLAILVGVAIVVSLIGIFSVQMGGLTGAAHVSTTNTTEENGSVYFDFLDVISISLDDGEINLGSGTLADNSKNITLESLNASSKGGTEFTIGNSTENVSDSFRLRNDGNNYIELVMNVSKNATTFVAPIEDGGNFTFLVSNQNNTRLNATDAFATSATKLDALFQSEVNDTIGACNTSSQSAGFGFEAQAPATLDLNSVYVGRLDNVAESENITLCSNMTWETDRDELDIFMKVVVPESGIKGNHSATVEFQATAI